MRFSKNRTDRLPTAVHRPDYLRSEGFHAMAERVEKQQYASEHLFAHLRASAKFEQRRRYRMLWAVIAVAVIAIAAASWLFWDQAIGLF